MSNINPEMLSYGREELRKALDRPSLIRYEIIRVVDESTVAKLQNWLFDWKYPDRVHVMEEDWDNLILLDACRFDYFAGQIDIEGNLEYKISQGGTSWPFMRRNFAGRELHDTIYVTANLHVEKLDENIFFKVESIPASERNPERVVKAAIDAHETYPNKRLIVHFMQPHRPYLGPTADQLRAEADSLHLREAPGVGDKGGKHIQPKIALSMFKSRAYPLSALRQMYRENLDIVLDHTYELLESVDGKSVLSADHGELLGERKGVFRQRKFGHPRGIKTIETFRVPWFEIESDERREIVSEEPLGYESLDDEIVRARLRELGYMDPEIS